LKQSPAAPDKTIERVMGIEPTLSAWEAEVLPLNYTRIIEVKHYPMNFILVFFFQMVFFWQKSER
jgi:hypothetical protein